MPTAIKKIDLNVHTLPNEFLDSDFYFDIPILKEFSMRSRLLTTTDSIRRNS